MGKGSDRERQYVELCNRAGMGTYRPATVRYGENDMMGLFDVLAFSPAHSAIHAVQVKSNAARGIRAWCGHTALFRELGLRTMYAVPVDREGWRIIDCRNDGRHAVVDERDLSCNMGDRVVGWLRGEAGE